MIKWLLNEPGINLLSLEKYPKDFLYYQTKVFVNGSWILDPRNPNTCTGGYGPNSELRMPAYQMPPEIAYYAGIAHGTLKDTTYFSVNLGNSRTIRVYLPPGYDTSAVRYPMMLFHDGLEYISLAQANHVLDFMIHQQRIEPTIAVFVPPVNRTGEYGGNLQAKFTKFIIEEIIPWMDARFRTIPSPEKRAVLGDSYGGNISLWLGLNHPDIFGNVAALSTYIQGSIGGGFQNGPKLNLKIDMILGTYDIAVLIPMVRDFIPILQSKGYSYEYHEYHEGHSWGNWRAHLDNALEMFFPGNLLSIDQSKQMISQFSLSPNYPNPFNSSTMIHYELYRSAEIKLAVFDIQGRLIRLFGDGVVDGRHYAILEWVAGEPVSTHARKPEMRTDALALLSIAIQCPVHGAHAATAKFLLEHVTLTQYGSRTHGRPGDNAGALVGMLRHCRQGQSRSARSVIGRLLR